jgi:hypothetical protein
MCEDPTLLANSTVTIWDGRRQMAKFRGLALAYVDDDGLVLMCGNADLDLRVGVAINRQDLGHVLAHALDP